MKHLLLSIGFLSITISGMAQLKVGIYAAGMAPIGAFDKYGYQGGGGMALQVLSPAIIEKKAANQLAQLHFGGALEYYRTGQRNFIQPTGNYRLQNSQFSVLGTMRLVFAPTNKLNPYLEVFTGIRSFYTATHENTNINGDNQSSELLEADFARHSGIGIGMLYQLPGNFASIDISMACSNGRRANWMALDDFMPTTVSGIYAGRQRTPTDMISIKAGIQFSLGASTKSLSKKTALLR